MRMVVSDLDGTLLRSDRSVSGRTMKFLERLAARNVLFMIATARAERSVHNMLPFNFENMYVICYNGAEIYHGRKLIYHNYLEASVTKHIVDWLQVQYPGIHIALEISNRLYTNFDIKLIKGWIPPYTEVDFQSFMHQPTAKILVDLRGMPDVTAITHMLPDCCSMVITDGGVAGQIAGKNVSKLNAIRSVAGSCGLGLEEVIAFGDDYNDIEMIRGCGIGVTMGNAPQAVKEAADIVTGTNDEDGVACVLEKVFNL